AYAVLARAAAAPLAPFALPAAARALWLALATTLLVRAVAPLLPGRYAWGVDLGRDLPKAAFWLPWIACALALVPALSAPVVARLPRAGGGLARLGLLVAPVPPACVRAFRGRAYTPGAPALRHGTFAAAIAPETYVPQAMPADLALHYSLPPSLAALGITADQAGRLWDALLAFVSVLAA